MEKCICGDIIANCAVHLFCKRIEKRGATHVTPGGNGTLVNVFDGNWETVADADARVDGAETAFAQHIANTVRPVEGFRINQLN